MRRRRRTQKKKKEKQRRRRTSSPAHCVSSAVVWSPLSGRRLLGGKKRGGKKKHARSRTGLIPRPSVVANLIKNPLPSRAASFKRSDMNSNTHVIQVTNVSPSTTSEQMRTLFGFLGNIEELKLFPPE